MDLTEHVGVQKASSWGGGGKVQSFDNLFLVIIIFLNGRGCPFLCFVALRLRQQLSSWRDRLFSSPNFFLGKLEQVVNKYFKHILSFVTDNNPS